MAQAILFDAPGSAVLVTQHLPEPGPGQVRVKAEVSLVSAGTERAMLLKAHAYPVTPGYSMVGRVTAVGLGVTRLAVGDRVIAHTAHASEANCDQRFVLPLAEQIPGEDAAFFVIGAMALYTVRLAALQLGDPLLIIGQGLIGLLATQVARMAGAAPITVVDVAQSRLDLARWFGADRAFAAGDREGLRQWLRTLPGGGPAATIELAGLASAVDTAIEVTRRRGRVVSASMVPAGHAVNIHGRAWLEGLHIIGAYFNSRPWMLETTETTSPLDWPVRPSDGGRYQGSDTDTSLGDIALFLRLLELGRFELQSIIGESVQAHDAPAMFKRLPQSDTLGHLIRWS